MEYDIPVKISNRHVHLTEETYNMLFDEKLGKKNDLSQIGQFAAKQTLTIQSGDKKIENVRIVGPLRPYNQIEISKKDARTLGLNPPVRRSGDLEDSLNITLVTEKNTIEVKGLILANRHIHMNMEDALKYGVTDNQIVELKIPGDRSGIVDAEVKITDDGVFEAHLDTDDGNAFLINDNDILTMIVKS